MNLKTKSDEYYMDGTDKWTVHYIASHDYRSNRGDYVEVIQIFKNQDLVGQTVWRKDKNGNSLTKAYEEGLYRIPAAAREVTTKS